MHWVLEKLGSSRSKFLLIFACTEQRACAPLYEHAEIIGDQRQKQLRLFKRQLCRKTQYALINAASHDVIFTPRDLLFFDEENALQQRLIKRGDILGPEKRSRIMIEREEKKRKRKRRHCGFRSRPRGVKDPRCVQKTRQKADRKSANLM